MKHSDFEDLGVNPDNSAENLAGEAVNVDDNVAGTQHLQEALADNEEEKIRAELAEQKDKYLRLFAEFDNFRRRTAKEKIEMDKTAGKEVLTSLLDVVDDMGRAQSNLQQGGDLQAFQTGVQLVFQKLKNLLEQKGVKEMDLQGKEFDADTQEAIARIKAPSPELVGKVVDVVQPGYTMNNTILRHAKVVVGE